uniref:Vacuolar protein sorting-associated protein 13 VPS13 adaptor binding domain-containing protein n=2 Tax=Clytia hemisphaerica TaxID=252671 RepID=A0A7M5XA64_9CNID
MLLYRNRKKAKGNICLADSDDSWSEDFSLSAIGDENHVDIKDQHNQPYTIHIENVMSRTNLTNIITLSPRCIISNHTQNDIQFAEADKPIADVQWLSLAPNQVKGSLLFS